MSEKFKSQWLVKVSERVTLNTTQKVFKKLEEIGLAEQDPIYGWHARGDLTGLGLNNLSTAISSGLEQVFCNSKIIYPPTIYKVDQNQLGDKFIRKIGQPIIRTQDNELYVEFDGKIPLIKSIVTPLNPNLDPNKKPIVTHYEQFCHGTEIAMLPEFDEN